MNARTSPLPRGPSAHPILGNRPARWARTWSQVAAAVAASGWAKMVRNTAATMSVWVLGACASSLLSKWTRQRWCAALRKERLNAATKPTCWSEMTDRIRSGRATSTRSEHRPRRLVLAVPDGQPEDLSATSARSPLGGGPADGSGARSRPRPDRRRSAKPRTWRRPSIPSAATRVTNGRGWRPGNVGLHHHGVRRLVDPAARLQNDRQVGALAQLGIVNSKSPAWVGLAPSRADLLAGFRFDQLLHHQRHRLADQVDPCTCPERLEQLGHGSWHKVIGGLLRVLDDIHTEEPADGSDLLEAARVAPKNPTTRWVAHPTASKGRR
jgi:hypothetical protein